MASIGFSATGKPYDTKWLTNGVLISENFVLTIAHGFGYHALDNRTAKYVRLGDLDNASDEDDAFAQQYNIIKNITYPLYKFPDRYHDIALLKIDKKIKFNEYIRPACLPDVYTTPSGRIVVPGWGQNSFRGNSKTYLQKVAMNLVSHRDCNETYAPRGIRTLRRGIDNRTHICAVAEFGRDACQVS